MFANDGGGAIILPSVDLTLVLLTSPFLPWSLLLQFLSLSFEPSQNMLHTVEGPQNYQFGVEVCVQSPF